MVNNNGHNKKENKTMEFISEHWITLLGGGSITGFFGWVFYGRKNQNAEFTSKVQGIYDNLVEDLKKDREELKEENTRIKKEHREDVVYFRNELDALRTLNSALQEQFNTINTAYVTEVESSKKWERLYDELLKEVVGLRNQVSDFDLQKAFTQEVSDSWEKKFNDLQKEHNTLKKAFDILKKSMK